MTQYFFDVVENGNLVRDIEGTELDGLQTARVEAIAILPDLAKGLKADDDGYDLAVTVRDVTGKPVFQAKFSLDCAWLE